MYWGFSVPIPGNILSSGKCSQPMAGGGTARYDDVWGTRTETHRRDRKHKQTSVFFKGIYFGFERSVSGEDSSAMASLNLLTITFSSNSTGRSFCIIQPSLSMR